MGQRELVVLAVFKQVSWPAKNTSWRSHLVHSAFKETYTFQGLNILRLAQTFWMAWLTSWASVASSATRHIAERSKQVCSYICSQSDCTSKHWGETFAASGRAIKSYLAAEVTIKYLQKTVWELTSISSRRLGEHSERQQTPDTEGQTQKAKKLWLSWPVWLEYHGKL